MSVTAAVTGGGGGGGSAAPAESKLIKTDSCSSQPTILVKTRVPSDLAVFT